MDVVDPTLVVAAGAALITGLFLVRFLWSLLFFFLKGALFLFFGGVVLTSAHRTFGPLQAKEIQGILAHASVAIERLYSEIQSGTSRS